MGAQPDDVVKIGYLGGIVDRKDFFQMKRLIFRAMRGKVFAHFFDIA